MKKEKEDERIGRLFAILGTLSPHSQVTVRDLAEEYEVSPRTIQRDLKALMNAELGIFYDNEKIKISRLGYRKIKSWMIGWFRQNFPL